MAPKTQAAGSHGVDALGYEVRTDTKPIPKVNVPYVKSINLNTVLEDVTQYANNVRILLLPSDQGFNGSIGVTDADPVLDEAQGYSVTTDDGNILALDASTYKANNIYYEFKRVFAGGISKTVKAWLYNVKIGKSNKTHNTDTNTITFTDYEYPIDVLGDPALNADGSEYRDENGNKRKAFMILAYPDDANYEGFEDACPDPIMPAIG